MSEVNTSAPVAAPEATAEQTQSPQVEQGNQAQAAPAAVVADLKDQAANGTPKEQAQAKKMLKELKIKFNGKEILEKLPFEIPDDESSKDFMTRHLQMSKMGATKAQEYSQLEKEVKTFIEELRKNPRRILADPNVGIDVKKLAAEVIEEEIANSQKSPEVLEKEKLAKELKELKEAREKEKEQAKQQEFERIQKESFERYDMLIGQALEKSDLPKSPYIVKKMADYMLLGLQNGVEIAPNDIVGLIREEIQGELKDMFAVMPEDVIQALIGKEVFEKVRKKNIAKAKSNKAPVTAQQVAKDTGQASPKKEDVAKKQSMRDFFGF